jgi:Protein tyrosine phosphatase
MSLELKKHFFPQAKDSVQQSISVARCYPMKNRSPDILPYDSSRVELPSTKDDYINASYIRCPALPNPPPLIVTQAPLNSTVGDFWTMVWEQSVELVVCLLTDQEVSYFIFLFIVFVWPWDFKQEGCQSEISLAEK